MKFVGLDYLEILYQSNELITIFYDAYRNSSEDTKIKLFKLYYAWKHYIHPEFLEELNKKLNLDGLKEKLLRENPDVIERYDKFNEQIKKEKQMLENNNINQGINNPQISSQNQNAQNALNSLKQLGQNKQAQNNINYSMNLIPNMNPNFNQSQNQNQNQQNKVIKLIINNYLIILNLNLNLKYKENYYIKINNIINKNSLNFFFVSFNIIKIISKFIIIFLRQIM